MSGGAFDYHQYFIGDMIDEIEQRILRAGQKIPRVTHERDNYYSWRYGEDIPEEFYTDYSPKTIAIMKRPIYVLRMAFIYAQRIDWMLSGDDGEDDLVERLAEELAELKRKYPSGRYTYKKKNIRFDEDCERYVDTTENNDP